MALYACKVGGSESIDTSKITATATFNGQAHGNQTLTLKLYYNGHQIGSGSATKGDIQPSDFSMSTNAHG